jgi:hypothetical protein
MAERMLSIGMGLPTIPGGLECPLPRMFPAEQRFPRPRVADVPAALGEAMAALPPAALAGKRVAVTCGSRGIPEAVTILGALVARLKAAGAEPFIVPAMGSHGGATAEGQRKVLEGYGVTESSVGAPVRASMDVVQVATLPEGIPLYCDAIARSADAIVLFNKIKPHTAYKTEVESGLLKMSAIGLGKHVGATTLHQFPYDVFPDIIRRAGETLVRTLPVLFGLAVVENAYGEVGVLEAIPPDCIARREPELLAEAKRIMSRLLVPGIDVLVVDEIGKEISGAGLDPNVTGRPATRRPGFQAPSIQKIVVRGVTKASHGNGVGIGMADFTTLRCAESLDLGAMYTNVFTARIVDGARIPPVLSNDREALSVAIKTCVQIDPAHPRVVRIKNTKALHQIRLSEACLPDIAGRADIVPVGEAAPLAFDEAGYLLD